VNWVRGKYQHGEFVLLLVKTTIRPEGKNEVLSVLMLKAYIEKKDHFIPVVIE